MCFKIVMNESNSYRTWLVDYYLLPNFFRKHECMLRGTPGPVEPVRMQTARAQTTPLTLAQLWLERLRLADRITIAGQTGDVPPDVAGRYYELGRIIAEAPALTGDDRAVKLALLEELAVDAPDGAWIRAIARTIAER
jgi:hypothetical protein